MTDDQLRDKLKQRIAEIEQRIAAACQRAGRDRAAVTLVVITKYVSGEVARLLPELGVTDLGESRPQELWKKAKTLHDQPIRWHQVGHLQRNKVEETISLVTSAPLWSGLVMIHSVDSLRLLETIETEASRQGKTIPILFEVNASREENKHGFAPEELPSIAEKLSSLKSTKVQGLMTMAAQLENPEECRATFVEARELRDRLQQDWGIPLPHLSMGMSNDFEIAIEEGATLIRLGSVLLEGLSTSAIE